MKNKDVKYALPSAIITAHINPTILLTGAGLRARIADLPIYSDVGSENCTGGIHLLTCRLLSVVSGLAGHKQGDIID